MSGIHAGQLVAVHLQDSSDEPAIGRVFKVGDREVRIQWMKGTYTSAWKPWTVWQGRNKRFEFKKLVGRLRPWKLESLGNRHY